MFSCWCFAFLRKETQLLCFVVPYVLGPDSVYHSLWYLIVLLYTQFLGRTIKEFIMHCMTIPVVYSFLWMSIFGGAGLKMERNAYWANITCDSALGGETSTKPGPNGLYSYRAGIINVTHSWVHNLLDNHVLSEWKQWRKNKGNSLIFYKYRRFSTWI